ncbi:MAG TPA: hypothetical protein VF071_11870 [Candidatus Limnocylindria bacterium]
MALIYGSQALLAALVGVWVGRRAPGVSGMAALLLAAWLGELAALTLFGNLLANEIDPEVAWVFWWMGTCGPLQPLAALLGALVVRSAGKRG